VHGRVRTIIAGAIVIGLLLRLAFAFGYWVGKPLTLDEQEYLLLATSVARGAGLTYPASAEQRPARHFERPPVFAVLLAGILRLTRDPLVAAPVEGNGMPRGFPRSSSEVPASIKITESLIGVMVIALSASLASKAGGPVAGAAAATLAALYPPLACSSGYVLSEPLYSLLALAVVWLLHRTDPTRAIPAWAVFAAGVAAGVAVLTKEAMILFLPFAGLWLLARRGLVPAVVLTLGLGVVLTPWIARNYAVYGRFVLTAPHGGVTFWTGNNPAAGGEGDLAANPEMGRARVQFERRHAGATAADLDSAYYREALRFIAQNPGAWTALLARKLFYTFVPIGPSYRLHSRLYYVATAGCYALVLPFAVLGLIGLLRRRRAGRLTALWLLALSTVVTGVVFFPQERFRLPVLDPALVVCAAAWFGSLACASRWFRVSHDVQGLV
jgi:hypothetical protein